MATFAGVYKWVDDKGAVNYGQKIPEKYKNQVKRVHIEKRVERYQPVEEKSTGRVNTGRLNNYSRPPTLKDLDFYGKDYSKTELPAHMRPDPNINANVPKKRLYSRKGKTSKRDSCSAKKAAYSRSLSCFRSCARPLPEGGTNNSGCGRCRSVSKPSC